MVIEKKERPSIRDRGYLIRHEGILNAQGRVAEINSHINSAQTIVDRLSEANLNEHSDYLHHQILPNFRSDMSKLSQILDHAKGFKRPTTQRDDTIAIVENFNKNLGYFDRFVSGFDNDKNYSFKEIRENLKINFKQMVTFLNQAGLRHIPKKEREFANRDLKSSNTEKTR